MSRAASRELDALSCDDEAEHHNDKDRCHTTRWRKIHTGGWLILLAGIKALYRGLLLVSGVLL